MPTPLPSQPVLPELEPDELVEALPARNERSRSRRVALQILYEVDTARHDASAVMAVYLNSLQPTRTVGDYIAELVNGVTATLPMLDDIIQTFAPDFPINQLATIDRNILRLAVWEFGIGETAPVGVVIDEAVELARLFGGDRSTAFINGVLGSIAASEETRKTMRSDKAADTSKAEPPADSGVTSATPATPQSQHDPETPDSETQHVSQNGSTPP